MDRVPCICKSEENAATGINRGIDVGEGGGHTPVISRTFVDFSVSYVNQKLMRVNINMVRIHVYHVLADGVTSLRSCRCSPRVLCEKTTNTKQTPNWKHGNDFDIGSVGIASLSWLPSGENTQVLSKT